MNEVLEKKEYIYEDQLIVNHEDVDKAIIPLLVFIIKVRFRTYTDISGYGHDNKKKKFPVYFW